jgi:hypothetical protein
MQAAADKPPPTTGRPTYLIVAHADPVHFHRLAGRLLNTGNVVAHINARSDIAPFLRPDVVFLEKRLPVSWGGYNLYEAITGLARTALRLFPDSSHFACLSGADYPIPPDRELAAFFRRNAGHEFIRFYNINTPPHTFRDHIALYRFCDFFGAWNRSGRLGRALKCARITTELLVAAFARKKWPARLADVAPCAGSTWWALTPACCRHILETIDADPFWTTWWRTTFAPDEKIFHTLVAHSDFLAASDGFDPARRYIHENANLHYLTPDLSRVFTLGDLGEVLDSGKIFIRKVTTARSTPLLDALDKRNGTA